MASRKAVGHCIGSITCRVVESNIVHDYIGASRDRETMDWIILDVEVLDHRILGHLAHCNEVIGFWYSAI